MRALLAAAVLAVAPGSASLAGTTVTYNSAGGGDKVTVGFDGGTSFVHSELGVNGCTATSDTNTVTCGPGVTSFVVNLSDSDDQVDTADMGSARLEAYGGAGADSLTGGPNNDMLDGGPGDNTFTDGAGNDVVGGGPAPTP